MANVILIRLDTVYIDKANFWISYIIYNMFKHIQLLHHDKILICYNKELLN